MSINKNTKIIATIGPACDTEDSISSLIKSGVNVFRFNMKHNVASWHLERINLVQKVADSLGFKIGIMIDLQGPEIRIETKDQKDIYLRSDEDCYFTTDFSHVNSDKVIRVAHSKVIEALDDGDKFSIDDGFHEFKVVEKVNKFILKARILSDSYIKNRKSLNLVGKDVDLPSLIEEDLDKLNIAAKSKVDFVALSFVRTKKDILTLREACEERKLNVKIVSKIESQKGLDNIDEIIKISDAIMIARGDLGIETPIERLTYFQKEIIKKCRQESTPVIVATQMLQSMIENPLPTRAEAADIANAVYDGTDCVMLSGETATGKYPQKAVTYMSKISQYNEEIMEPNSFIPLSTDQTHALVKAALTILNDENSVKIDKLIVATETGYTARVISSYRPSVPIIALSENEKTVEFLTMNYGVDPYHIKFPEHDLINSPQFTKELIKLGCIKKGDTVLVIHGKKWKDPGNTNSLFIFKV